MPRTQSETSVRARIIAVIKSSRQGATVEEVRMWGDCTHSEKINLAVNIDKAYRSGLIDRHKVDNTGGAKRAKVFCYTAKGACPFESEPPPPAAVRTLRADHAADALANPPRGRSVQVPSLASAPNPNARKAAPLFACGDVVAVSVGDDVKPDEQLIDEEAMVAAITNTIHRLRGGLTRAQVLGCLQIAGQEIVGGRA